MSRQSSRERVRIPTLRDAHSISPSLVKNKNRPRSIGNRDRNKAAMIPKNSMWNTNDTTYSSMPHWALGAAASAGAAAGPWEGAIAGGVHLRGSMGSPLRKDGFSGIS